MKPSIDNAQNADFFNALAHKRRQMLCEILLKHGAKGLPVHRLKQKSGLKVSTLTHHLHHMTKGNLIQRRQKGRETWISVNLAYFHTNVIAIDQSMTQLAAV